MRKVFRIAFAAFVCTAITFGISSTVSAGGKRPVPPTDVLCGCICPDGSLVTTHAANLKSCDTACALACAGIATM